MNSYTLTQRSLVWFWRTHTAVVLGVATAIAVLTGALLVGDSVRGSLRDLVLLRLGATDHVILSTGFVREALASDLERHPDFSARFNGVVPLILTDGFARTQIGSGRAGSVRVYGVDTRFWNFHGIEDLSGPVGREAFLSPPLAAELGAAAGDTILIRVQRPTDMPAESVYGEKDDLGQTVRATVGAVLSREQLGEFSLEATQTDIRAVFLPLALLQNELGVEGRVTALLLSDRDSGPDDTTASLERMVRERASLDDLGLSVSRLEEARMLTLRSDNGLLSDSVIDAAGETAVELNLEARPVFTYLANTLEGSDQGIPYSLVTAIDLGGFAPEIALRPDTELPPVILNDWAANDLGAQIGDPVTLEYYFWEEPGRLLTRTTAFEVAGVVPVGRADPGLAPTYPGISDSPDLGDWDPPFPIDLDRIRPADEEYWDQYRTTPKAFIPLALGQELWQSRHGSLTSIRYPLAGDTDDGGTTAMAPLFADELRGRLDPLSAGLTVANVRTEGLEASRGAVNFGEYFVYFSFFLVVSALMLAALFFKLSVEQRAAEIGLLRATGFTPAALRRVFMQEGLWLSVAGALAGGLGGVGYAWLIVRALGTWWVGAVGTTHLTLHLSWVSIAAGVGGGIAAALACIWITLGSLARVSERRLLAGQLTPEVRDQGGRGRTLPLAAGCVVLAGTLVALTAMGLIPEAGGFFGAGTALLVACLSIFVFWSRRQSAALLDGGSRWPLTRLGLRNVTWRPARSVVAVAMIASATFILISVDAFRTEGIADTGPQTGIGGYSLIAETMLPLVYDPETEQGLAALGLDGVDGVRVDAFRLRPGDDTSCLNLYAPQNPRIAAPSRGFLERGRFRFSDSLASTPAEGENPWLLLEGRSADGAIPVAADKHSITYVLNRSLGDDIVISEGDRTLRLRLVAALDDSIFQGELLMSEANFREAFPDRAGYSYLLVESSPENTDRVQDAMASALEDHGVQITGAAARLAAFHQVENTYLSTFQALGALGLLLGTVGLGAILLRNILERRKEMALLRALGYKQPDFMTMAVAENALLLTGGLLTGGVCALLAITPALVERGGQLPGDLLLLLLCGVFGLGLITSLVATTFALRAPLLAALRSE